MTLELLHVRHARDHLLFYQKLCQHSGFVENVCLSMKKTMMCQSNEDVKVIGILMKLRPTKDEYLPIDK